jgi:voltage-gated potassium channel
MVDVLSSRGRFWIDNILLPLAVTTGLVTMVADTDVAAGTPLDEVLNTDITLVAMILTAELVFRIWEAPRVRRHGLHGPWCERMRYLTSPNGLIDVAAVLALPAGYLTMARHSDAHVFAAVWALKYLRHSTGLNRLIRVASRARVALFSVMTLFFVVFLSAASLAYLFERGDQPEASRSIPRAMWWAIVTLTTTGYGDIVPHTVWGRLLAGWVMVGGIVVFALWAGIIANAFAEELRRRDFLRTWDLVAHASFFQNLGTAAIADVVKLLHTRDASAGTVLFRRGQYGDAMYFIVSGEVSVEIGKEPLLLGAGDFVGEMALLFDAPRAATVVVTRPSRLLVLDIANFRELASHRPELVTTIEAEGKRRRDANRSVGAVPA